MIPAPKIDTISIIKGDKLLNKSTAMAIVDVEKSAGSIP